MSESAMVPISTFCTAQATERPYVQELCKRLRMPWHLHRKLWEFGMVCEAVEAAGLLKPGTRALGFGVGVEPLVAFFAAAGVEVLATDTKNGGWFNASKAKLNAGGLCDPAKFEGLVRYREVDMNWIPRDLQGFDFAWSCCSLDHLGSIRLSKRFVYRCMQTLRQGGLAVHTGEFGPKLDWKSPDNQDTVVWTKWDVDEVCAWLQIRGHLCQFDFSPELDERDTITNTKHHIRKLVKGVESTSFGLIIQKSQTG